MFAENEIDKFNERRRKKAIFLLRRKWTHQIYEGPLPHLNNNCQAQQSEHKARAGVRE